MRKYNLIWLVSWLFIATLTQAWAQVNEKPEPLPIDPKVRYGKLDNGLTYYIRHNELPKERAHFYIAQNVGSILEEENQRGLAHFLEHMAFDGSKNFPDNGMDSYIERVGMRSGQNFNAYTSFDETVYMITDAPVRTEGVVDSCLLILHDWSGFLSLTDSAIQKERGVIREEWRTSQSASQRIYERLTREVFPGSRYANRWPIGKIEVIENFKPEELKAYYKKWYRPDLQAIIVVGDIDVDQVEGKIRSTFADVPAPVNPARRKQEQVADNKEPIVSIVTDKEAPNTVLNIYHKHDPLPEELEASVAGLIKDYMQTVSATIMTERFDEILQRANPPFVYAGAGDGDFIIAKTKEAWNTGAVVKEGEIDSTLVTLVRETQRLKRYGFTASEYERARINVLKQIESAYNERDNQRNDAYVSSYITHFTRGGNLTGIETYYTLMNQLAPRIGVEQVNQYIQGLIDDENVVITLTGPEKEGLSYPTPAELLEAYEAACLLPVEPYREEVSNEPLIPELPEPGRITDTREDPRFGATVMTLSNGIRVVLKPTELKKDEILMTASRPGGSSVFGKDDAYNLKLFNDVNEIGGLGNFSATDLGKRLAGKNVSCAISLSQDRDNVNGRAVPADLKTLFELIYMEFTAPRIDEEAYASFETRLKAQLENIELNPRVAIQDTTRMELYGDDPRAARLRPDDFSRISYDRIMKMRDERFGDASGFVFTFVGNIRIDSVKPLVERYIASLPTSGKVMKADPDGVPRILPGSRSNVFRREMEVPKVTVAHFYTASIPYNEENRMAATMLERILNLVFFDTVREKEGGTYGIGVSADLSYFPREETILQVFFDTDPAKWERMNQIVSEEIRRIADEGPTEENFRKTRDNLLKHHAEVLQENGYWLSVLDHYYDRGIDAHTDYESVVGSMTPAKIQSIARQLLDQHNRVEVIMRP